LITPGEFAFHGALVLHALYVENGNFSAINNHCGLPGKNPTIIQRSIV
jgi:hypothetical protein